MNLPERKGFTIVHGHDEGRPCIAPGYGVPYACEYRPTLRNRIVSWLRVKRWL